MRLEKEESEQQQWCRIYSTVRLTGQSNLTADTDNARSPNRICSDELTQREQREKALLKNQQTKKVNRPAESGILIPAQHIGGREGLVEVRSTGLQCDQNLTNPKGPREVRWQHTGQPMPSIWNSKNKSDSETKSRLPKPHKR